MRFGNDLEACLKAVQIGFELSPRPSDTIYQGAVKTLEMVPVLLLYLASHYSAGVQHGGGCGADKHARHTQATAVPLTHPKGS